MRKMALGCLALNCSYLSLISFVNVFTVDPKDAYPAKDDTTGLTEKRTKDFIQSITRKDVTEAWLVMYATKNNCWKTNHHTCKGTRTSITAKAASLNGRKDSAVIGTADSAKPANSA